MIEFLDTTKWVVFYHCFIRYIKVGLLLHIISIGFVIFAFEVGRGTSHMHGFFCLYGLMVILFAQKDAFSRFQNYKRAKDLFFENGFKTRIVKVFINSRCQRDAIKVAAHDLGMKKELTRYYYVLGYRWYHMIPDIIFKQPSLLATAKFWKNTLLVPHYQSKYFLW